MPESRIDAFMMRMLKSLKPSARAAGQTIVILHRAFVSLIPDLLSVFKGDRDVEVIADRRSRGKADKKRTCLFGPPAKRAKREKAELLEVVFGD